MTRINLKPQQPAASQPALTEQSGAKSPVNGVHCAGNKACFRTG